MSSRSGSAGPGVAMRWAALACLLLAGAGAASAEAAQHRRAPARPSFSTQPQLDPAFAWGIRDYAVRCSGDVKVHVKTPGNWLGKVGSGPFRAASFVAGRSLDAGQELNVTFHRPGHPSYRRFHLRCLPSDFPPYEFTRTAPGGPGFFIVQMQGQYATIFDRHGDPIWWYKASGEPDNAELLPNGTIAFDPVDELTFQLGDYEIRTLRGRLVHTIQAIGGPVADIHDLLLLPNGNYLFGAQVQKQHVDTSSFGGSSDATVTVFQIQEVTPGGQLVWKWNSFNHIGLGQTPQRWWDSILQRGTQPYDIQHWNSVERHGNRILLSFRHLDAVYEINRSTGEIVWKLGGTHTPKSLKVLNDPDGSYPLAAAHDARLDPDGTVTIHDNFTDLGKAPRAVRYRIDEQAGTARLVQSISDPEASSSICCGSSRRLPSGDWLIGWGGIPFVGAYDADGHRLFKLDLLSGFSYRAFPVPSHALSAKQLRRAMNAMHR